MQGFFPDNTSAGIFLGGLFIMLTCILHAILLPFALYSFIMIHYISALIQQVFLDVYVVVQFYPWFKFYFLLFLGMETYDTVNPLLSPPGGGGGYFFSSTFEGGA